MSAPDTPARGVGVAPADPANPFTPKPLIADILRTRYCIAGSIFLVEGIDASIAVTKRYRTVRLLLGDGELCIQALLSGEIHSFVDSGTIYLGCYVRVNKFEVRFFTLGGDADKMAYLVVEDLVAVGWNTTYLEMVKDHDREQAMGSTMALGMPPEVPEEGHREASTLEKKEVVAQDEFENDSDLDDAFEVIGVSLEKATLRRAEARRQLEGTSTSQAVHASSLPWTSSDPTKPLKLTSLRSIPNLPYKQNWIVNVLAVVASLSDLEPSHLPPFNQRTARLADPTTTKQVLLTVFLDPEEFAPKVGTVVLLVGVKNHRFDGGSLKKYASDRPKNSARWWFPEPLELGWCDVVGLRRWWDDRNKV